MSYGSGSSLTRNAGRYREMEVASATPGQLVIILYDHLLTHLIRAAHAAAPDQIDARSDALSVCRDVVTELLVTLDRERGGDIAVHLAAIYSFVLGELAILGMKPEPVRLNRITKIVQDLRDAFAEAVVEAAGSPGSHGPSLSVA